MLGKYEQLLVFFAMFVLMVGIGTTMRLGDIKGVVLSPKKVLLGCLVQFGWMPLLAFTVSKVLNLSPMETLALILVGCTPGGTSSNMFAWFARGDVPLSLSMTLFSSLLAVLLMPILVGVYSGYFDSPLVIPLKEMALTMLFVFIPISIGLALNYFNFSYLEKLQKIGAMLGILATTTMLITWLPKLWADFSWQYLNTYLAILLLGNLGFVLGYSTSRVLGLVPRVSRTISLETGLQNTLLTFSIMTISFSAEFVDKVGWIPLVYGATMLGVAAVYVVIFRLSLIR